MTLSNKIFTILIFTITMILVSCNSDEQLSFQKSVSIKSDTLKLDNTKDTLLIGSKGTLLFFEKESFQFEDGKAPKGNIQVILKECYSIADMLKENLNTMTSSQLLETNGMVNVSAFADDKELQLKNGKKIIIHFPKKLNEKKEMNLFYPSSVTKNEFSWALDTTSLLKPAARITGSSATFESGVDIDTSKNGSFWDFQDTSKKDFFSYFDSLFDNSRISNINRLIGKKIVYKFNKSSKGTLDDLKIYEAVYDTLENWYVKTSGQVDQYFYEFIKTVPVLKTEKIKGIPTNAPGQIVIKVEYYPDYKKNKNYNELFLSKYSMFKEKRIQSVNDLELNYYIFNSSKLGWINCDYFWNTTDEKIDFIVKVDPNTKPNIKLVFKNVSSIMNGVLDGANYIFKNVPANQEVKIVAISFIDNKPLLSISETRTNRKEFDKLTYKEFSLAELDRQLSSR